MIVFWHDAHACDSLLLPVAWSQKKHCSTISLEPVGDLICESAGEALALPVFFLNLPCEADCKASGEAIAHTFILLKIVCN